MSAYIANPVAVVVEAAVLAAEHVLLVDQVILQSDGSGEDLEGRTWSNEIGNGPVPPGVLGVVAKGVWVEAWHVGHGKDVTRLRVHHNTDTANCVVLHDGD